MESSVAVFLMRQSACELLPTISLLQQRNVERERQHSGPEKIPRVPQDVTTRGTRAQAHAQIECGCFDLNASILKAFFMREVG